MKISVNIDYKEAEVDGFGIVKVRPLGAGEELEMAKINRKINEMRGPVEELTKLGDKATDKDIEKANQLQEEIAKCVERTHSIVVGTFSADDPKVLERLINELSFLELARVSREILANA